MLLKECKRCGKLIPYGLSYCATCRPIVQEYKEQMNKERKSRANSKYNKKRDPKYVRFYNSKEWRALSLKKLQDDNYKCVKCGKYASEVDHIKPIQTDEGWSLRYDYDNLQSLCFDCHNKKHNRFQKKKGKLNIYL